MPSFEPSTWAEVEEAQASRKASAQVTDPFVTKVRAFTDAPERFLSSSEPTPDCSQPPPGVSEVLSSDGEDAPPPVDVPFPVPRRRPRPPLSRIKRNDGQFDDLLGLGRVDIETMAFVRKYAATPNVEEFSVTPASAVGKDFSRAPLNPSSNAFDPVLYLRTIHQDTPLNDLVRGKETLNKLQQRFDEEAEQFRREKYVSAALVEAAFDITKTSQLSISPFASGRDGVKTGKVFEEASAALKERYEDVLSREKKLASLRRTLGVYTRYQWLFGLGARLRSSVAEGVSSVEGAAREYVRGLKWLEAQDDASLQVIQRDINEGFKQFTMALLNQLSTSQCSQQETSRLVTVLTSVKKENLLAEALSRRISFAVEGLRKSSQPIDVGPVLGVHGNAGKTPRETTELISNATSAFFEGLSHVWSLARVMVGQERWARMVELQLLQFSETYAKILRENLLADISLVSRVAVRDIASVRRNALKDLQVPASCLKPVEEANDDITECFFRSISSSVENSMHRLASQAVEGETVGTEAAKRVYSVLAEAMDQIEDSLVGTEEEAKEPVDNLQTIMDETSLPTTPEEREAIVEKETDVAKSGVNFLGKTCAQMPGLFVQQVHGFLREKDSELDSKALKLAVCCTELLNNVVELVRRKTEKTAAFDGQAVRNCLTESELVIQEVLQYSTITFVKLVSAPLQRLVRGMVSFPVEELEDSVSRTVPIKIEGISKSANEITLQLALITIETRRRSESTNLIHKVLLSLIQDIGDTLVEVLSTDKLVYHRAAQLWVDVTYMQDMITKGADSDATDLQQALDGYSRVKERAVQAVLADGYSFSLADMAVLKESVVAAGMRRAQMVLDCFRETWVLLRNDRPGPAQDSSFDE